MGFCFFFNFFHDLLASACELLRAFFPISLMLWILYSLDEDCRTGDWVSSHKTGFLMLDIQN